jgi:hypothetical protein
MFNSRAKSPCVARAARQPLFVQSFQSTIKRVWWDYKLLFKKRYSNHPEWNNVEFFLESFVDYIQNGKNASLIAKEFVGTWLKETRGKL